MCALIRSGIILGNVATLGFQENGIFDTHKNMKHILMFDDVDYM